MDSLDELDDALEGLLRAGLLAVDGPSEVPRFGVPGERWEEARRLVEGIEGEVDRTAS